MKICVNCGARENDTMIFCSQCKEKLGEPISGEEKEFLEKQTEQKLAKSYKKSNSILSNIIARNFNLNLNLTIPKIIFIISLLPYVFIILYALYSAIFGFDFFGTTYGIEAFFGSLLLWIAIYIYMIPVIPLIFFIYQIVYLIITIEQKFYNKNKEGDLIMNIRELGEKLSQSSEIVITVLGDYCLDKYLYIDSDRDEKSLETGLIAYQVTKKGLYPGAAGTVVNNLRSLKVRTLCVGVIGDDGEGYELLNALKKIGADTSYMLTDPERCTSTYTKPMRGDVELNRLDFKNFSPMSKQTEQKLSENIYAAVEKSNAVIVLDQFLEENCNTINSNIREEIAVIAEKYPDLIIYADSRAYINLFKNIMVKCNKHEVGDGVPDVPRNLKSMYQKNKKPVFVTMGEDGSIVFDKDGEHKIPAIKVEGPIDICGAGDACTSGIVLGMALGASPEVAAMLGNIISSITIKQIGVTGTATQEQVLKVIEGIV